MRQQLRAWLSTNHLTGTPHHHVLLAVGEAVANVIEPAYPTETRRTVDIRATIRNGTLHVVVGDHGTWQQPIHVATHRGRGSQVMADAADTFDRISDAGGTTVTLEFALDTAQATR